MIASYIAADSVLPLTIALVVFIMLTVVLAAFVVLVCASPRFRRFLFPKDEPNKTERENEQTKDKEPEQEKPRNQRRAQPTSDRKRAVSPRASAKRRDNADYLVYTDSVPTVPLDAPPVTETSEKPRSRGGKSGR